MTREAAAIARRLLVLAGGIRALADRPVPDDERRYLLASAELVGREGARLDRALADDDAAVAAWALRSAAGMMKGLIDVGADLPGLAPGLWAEAGALADQAHAVECRSRAP